MPPGDWNTLIQPALARIDHRPWPMPESPPAGYQRWINLAFLHWPVPVERLRPFVPAPLSIQEFDGTSWAGIVPFDLRDLCSRLSPRLSLDFPELNLRLYVEADGKPGVWFISLDAASTLAVFGARASFRLPYFRALMAIEDAGREVRFVSRRRRSPDVAFRAAYRPAGDEFEPKPGTLDYFLIERYCLYTQWHDGRVLRLDIQHPPWRVSAAEVEIDTNTLASRQGIVIDERVKPIAHFSRRQDTLAWMPRGRGHSN